MTRKKTTGQIEAMTEDALRELKRELWREGQGIRSEMLEIEHVVSTKAVERKAAERAAALSKPGALMAQIEGVAAAAAAGQE